MTLPVADEAQHSVFQSNGEPAEDENMRLIDQKIKSHESSILELKTRRNTFSPIHRLPPEVFCRIFDFVRHEYVRTMSLRWIKVSHVCRHWRNMAVNAPSLWATPPLGNKEWGREMFERSKMASLTIIATLTERHAHENFNIALQNAWRIQTLTLVCGHIPIQSVLDAFPKSAPRLESCTIDSTHRYLMPGCPPFKLPEVAFYDTDRLRRLEILKTDVSWDSQLFSSLTHFKLDDISLGGRPSTSQLLNMLRRMPDLEVLELRNCLAVDGGLEDADSSRQPVLHLSSLQTLNLTGTHLELEPLLRRISAPTTTRLSCMASSCINSDFTAFITAFSRVRVARFRKDQGPVIRTLSITSMNPTNLRFSAFSEILPEPRYYYHDMTPIPYTEIGLAFQNPVSTSQVDQCLRAMYNALPLGNLVKLQLSLSYCVDVGARTLADTYGSLASLRSLCVIGTSTSFSVLKAMVSDSEPTVLQPSGSASRPTPVAFSSLQSLVFRNLDFNEGGGSHLITIGQMEDFLIERYERGAEVQQLQFAECTRLSSDDVEAFGEIVVDVVWDHVEMGFTETEEEEEYDYDHEYDPYGYYDSDSDDDYAMFPFGF